MRGSVWELGWARHLGNAVIVGRIANLRTCPPHAPMRDILLVALDPQSQTYVALSRITSLDGLYLTRGLRPSDIIVDPDVERFMTAATITEADDE